MRVLAVFAAAVAVAQGAELRALVQGRLQEGVQVQEQSRAGWNFFKAIGTAVGIGCTSGGQTAGQTCGAGCPCAGQGQCRPGLPQICVAKGKANEGCSAFVTCESGLSCMAIVQTCSHSPPWIGEACGAGSSCAGEGQCRPGIPQICVRKSKVNEGCSSFVNCESGLKCVALIQKCAHSPGLIGEACGPGYPCGKFSDSRAPELSFDIYCQPGFQRCGRDHPCDGASRIEGELDERRIRAENRAIELSIEVKAIQIKLVALSVLAKQVADIGPRPTALFARFLYDTRKVSLTKTLNAQRAEGQLMLARIKPLKAEISALVAEGRRVYSIQQTFPCAIVLTALNKLVDDIIKAANAFAKWVEENKCLIIRISFAVVGTIGDVAFTVVAAGTGIGASAAAQKLNPVCVKLTAGKFTIPATGKASLVTMGLDFLKDTACAITQKLGVDSQALVDACAGLDVAIIFVSVMLNVYCGNPGSALGVLASAAAECAAGCYNGFCPDGKVPSSPIASLVNLQLLAGARGDEDELLTSPENDTSLVQLGAKTQTAEQLWLELTAQAAVEVESWNANFVANY